VAGNNGSPRLASNKTALTEDGDDLVTSINVTVAEVAAHARDAEAFGDVGCVATRDPQVRFRVGFQDDSLQDRLHEEDVGFIRDEGSKVDDVLSGSRGQEGVHRACGGHRSLCDRGTCKGRGAVRGGAEARGYGVPAAPAAGGLGTTAAEVREDGADVRSSAAVDDLGNDLLAAGREGDARRVDERSRQLGAGAHLLSKKELVVGAERVIEVGGDGVGRDQRLEDGAAERLHVRERETGE